MNGTSMTPRAWAELLLLADLWGASFFSIAIAQRQIAPVPVVLHRVGWAALLLWLAVLALRLPLPRDWRVWGAILVMGGGGMPQQRHLVHVDELGQTRIESALVSIFNAITAPLVTLLIPPVAILLGWAYLGETLAPRAFAGFGLIVAGLAVLDGRLCDNARPSEQEDEAGHDQRRDPEAVEVQPAAPQEGDAEPLVDGQRDRSSHRQHGGRVHSDRAQRHRQRARRRQLAPPARRRDTAAARPGPASARRRAPSPSGTTRGRAPPCSWSCRPAPGADGHSASDMRPSRAAGSRRRSRSTAARRSCQRRRPAGRRP